MGRSDILAHVWRRLLPLLCLLALALPLSAETVLILPFFNVSKARNLDWIGDSLSETILEAFAAEGVGVVPPENRDEILRQMSVRRYARLTRASVMEIAVNCDAGVVVYGEFDFTPAQPGSPSKGALRVALRVLDVRRMKRGAEFNVTGPLEGSHAQSRSPGSRFIRSLQTQHRPRTSFAATTSGADRRSATCAVFSHQYRSEIQAVYQRGRLDPPTATVLPPGQLNFAARTYRGAFDWLRR